MDDFTAGIGRREAKLSFTISDFRFEQPGDFVRCAVTGTPIAIDALRYWNADVQEAYATPDAMLKRHEELRKAGGGAAEAGAGKTEAGKAGESAE